MAVEVISVIFESTHGDLLQMCWKEKYYFWQFCLAENVVSFNSRAEYVLPGILGLLYFYFIFKKQVSSPFSFNGSTKVGNA